MYMIYIVQMSVTVSLLASKMCVTYISLTTHVRLQQLLHGKQQEHIDK